MKEFITHLKDKKKPLSSCVFDSFEAWSLDDGLSTFGKFQTMDWDDVLSNQLFDHYSTVILELEKRRQEQEEVEELES
ncbi:unnamed protein product [Parnassius apollo]|uniref:(apollo) hypothetical protein n=1 Tax=Parnassius apollo TaxID=110799 RepID=A0A8S3XCX7_PARAO|nr:unnamed protein product [Parnassius apollo]